MKHKTFFAVVAIALMATSCLKVTKKSEVAAQPAKLQSTPTQTQQPKVINRELRLDDVFVEFHANVKGIAPGQSAVFYEGNDLLGGGIIQSGSIN